MAGAGAAGGDAMGALLAAAEAEIGAVLAALDPELQPLPRLVRSRKLELADATMMLAPAISRRKLNPKEYTPQLAAQLNEEFARPAAGGGARLVVHAAGAGPYLNLKFNRARVFRQTVERVLGAGGDYGKSSAWAGKRVVVEHTSSNPNAPLHIGNLRNVMVGAHAAKLLEAAGATVEQRFYVNDLGAQIGLTALGYSRVYGELEPTMKIDQWIGSMYAVMNTLNQLQQSGVDIHALLRAEQAERDAGAAGEVAALRAKAEAAAGEDAKKRAAVGEYVEIFHDLFIRDGYEKLLPAVVGAMRGVDSIQVEAGKLNLAYEQQEPWAIKIFRKMVIDCLTGVQETLSTYNVRHDRFDFESELGWEGANKAFLDIMKNSAYFVPQTHCNAEGVPQGAYMDMTQFIADQKLPTGKKGYMKQYPNLYVLRPDGSTLYTFRDIVYSFNKAKDSDMVLNVIAFEQNLAQQKVALAMHMMNPDMVGRQFHLGYEIVKLTSGKMSGRRGRYLLADDLYNQLKEEICRKMSSKYQEKGVDISQEEFDAVTHEVSTAAMKYALLAVSCETIISFDIAKVTDFEDASAPFLLYNSTRLSSVIRKHEEGVRGGQAGFDALPALDQVDFSLLDDQREWEMLLEYVLPFAAIVASCTPDSIPPPPALPKVHTHRMCEFLNQFVRSLSSYYGPSGVRILPSADGKQGGGPAMAGRIYLCKAFRQVIDNGLRLTLMEPLERM